MSSGNNPNSFSLENKEVKTICMPVFSELYNKTDPDLTALAPELPDIAEMDHDHMQRNGMYGITLQH